MIWRTARALALLAALTVAPAIATAQAALPDDPAALARAATAELERAAAALEEVATRRDRVAALTATVSAYEEGLSALRAGLRLAARREAALEAALAARSAEVSRLLGVLASMNRAPEALTLLHPSGPVGTARAAMIVGAVTPSLQAEAMALRRDLEEIAALRDIQLAAQRTLDDALRGAQEARTTLSRAIADRTDLPRRFTADPERMRELLAASDTLAAFAAGLGPPGGAPSGPADGGEPSRGDAAVLLPLPVDGVLLRRFGEADAAGVARPGLMLATRPAALVTAPFDATIRYAGPLLDYGNVMILEPDAATLVVLSGLGTLYGGVGQIVSRGDPLGLMGGAARPLPARSDWPAQTLADAERSETLYIEIRRGETPVDPADWFAIDRQE